MYFMLFEILAILVRMFVSLTRCEGYFVRLRRFMPCGDSTIINEFILYGCYKINIIYAFTLVESLRGAYHRIQCGFDLALARQPSV